MAGGGAAVMVLAAQGSFALAGPADGAPTARFTKGPFLQELSDTSVVVRVEVDPPGPVFVEVSAAGAAADAGRASDAGRPQRPPVASSEVRAVHSVRVAGLDPGTRYAYAVHAGASSAGGGFTTAPKADAPPAPVRFLVYGDNRSDDAAHAAVVRAMLQVPSDFLVHTGDFVGEGTNPAEWQTFFDIERPLLRDRCAFACVGNHELFGGGGEVFARYFAPEGAIRPGAAPRLYGTFRWGTVRLFVLNAFQRWDRGEDREWLDRELSRSLNEAGVLWRFVVLHHGPWSAGPHGDNARLHDASLPALLSRSHVDLVLAGHDHLYERGLGLPPGAPPLRYLVSGGGGAPLYRVAKPHPALRKSEAVHHFVEIGAEAERVTLVVHRADGSILERCGFGRGATDWDCDAPPPPPAPVKEAPPPPPPSKCACSVPGAPREGGARLPLALALTLAAARRLLKRR